MEPTDLGSVERTYYDYLHGEVKVWHTHRNMIVDEALPVLLEEKIHFYIEHEEDNMLRFMFYQEDEEKIMEIFSGLEEQYQDWDDEAADEDGEE